MTVVRPRPASPAAAAPSDAARGAPWRLLVVHGLCWALYGTVTHWGGVVHTDMLEAWAWGREFEPGYYKHPPVFAWVTGLWFAILPRTNGAFYLLASLNAGVGLLGIWRLGLKLGSARDARLGIALLTLTPLYNVLALTFNANAILLSVWPWATLAFLRSLRSGRALDGVLFGAGCALALLSKYYSAVLVLSCLGAACAFTERRRYFGGPAPWAAVATCIALCLPYTVWSLESGFAAVEYALSKTDAPRTVTLARAATALGGGLAYFAGVALLVGLAQPAVLGRSRHPLAAPLVWLAAGPAALTLGAALLGNVNISTRYLIPAFFLVPALVLSRLRPEALPAARIQRIAWLAPLVALVAAPAVALGLFRTGVVTMREPRRDLAAFATELVRRETGRPLRIVGGSVDEALAIVFYSPDEASDFTSLDVDQAPWITPERLATTSVLVVCGAADTACLQAGQVLEQNGIAPISFVGEAQLWGLAGSPFAYTLYVVPPGRAGTIPWRDLALSRPSTASGPGGRIPAKGEF